MNRLIEDLLDANRIERGALNLAAAPVSLAAIVGEASAMLRPLAQSRGIVLETDRPAPHIRLPADTTRVLQVLSNLIGNALKFTPKGGRVHLGTGVVETSHALLRSEDTGPGIPADKLPQLFNRFWQADSADRRGVGLGLAIARGIVEAPRGRIWADSEIGRGSVFSFTLPLAGADSAREAHAEPAVDAADAARL